MKILLLICEGPHDTALLYKIVRFGLRAKDVSGLKLKQFPELMYNHFITLLKNHDYENSQLVGRPEMPTVLTLEKDGDLIYVLIYSVGGESQEDKWIKQIQAFIDLSSFQLLGEEISISLGLFFDADDGSIKRLNKCKKVFKAVLPEIEEITIENKICFRAPSFIATGLYIISDHNGVGNVENILMPLMALNNETIFSEAREYIRRNLNDRRPTSKKFKQSYHESKSIIGVAGQLQYSGVANQNIIKQTDYIDETKILSDTSCINIADFLRSLVSVL